MNITITGNLGSGKTSVCKELKKMGFEVISTGSIFRQIAEDKGLSVTELNEIAKTERWVDDLIDSKSTQLGKEKEEAIFDSRMAWHFIPDSFKVFLLVDTDEAAKRVYNDNERNAEKYNSAEEAASFLKKRAELEQDRFKELYGVDYYNVSNYNLIIESSNASPESIAKEICRNYELYKENVFDKKIELNPSSLYPTQSFRDFSQDILNEYYEAEQKNNNNCISEAVLVKENNGYLYLIDGHHHNFAGAAAGKEFVEIEFDNSSVFDKSIYEQSKSELYNFEDLGHFRYRDYPVDKPRKNGYMINWESKEKDIDIIIAEAMKKAATNSHTSIEQHDSRTTR